MSEQQLRKLEIEYLVDVLKGKILRENTSTHTIRYDVGLIDKLEKMLEELE